MTLRVILLSIGMILTLSTHSIATPTPVQTAFQTTLNKLDSAEQHLDAKAWGKILRSNSTPYFKMYMQGHSPANIDQTISNEASFLQTMQSISRDTEHITSFDLLGNLGNATVTADEIAYIRDTNGELGKPNTLHKFEVVTHEAFALSLDNGVWKIQSITTTVQTISVDGHMHKVSLR